MKSVFISYGSPDVGFARRLNSELSKLGINTFFFEVDAIPGPIKLLLATEAFGMGVDVRDIERVVNAGPPCTLESKNWNVQYMHLFHSNIGFYITVAHVSEIKSL